MNMALSCKSKERGYKPSFLDIFKIHEVDAKLYIRRIPMSKIPVSDERECANFLNKLYQEKVFFKYYTQKLFRIIIFFANRTKSWMCFIEQAVSIHYRA